MARINVDKNWLFLMEPHTASRFCDSVCAAFGGVQIGDHHITPERLVETGAISTDRLHQLTILAVARNPFDALVTRWKFSMAHRQCQRLVPDLYDAIAAKALGYGPNPPYDKLYFNRWVQGLPDYCPGMGLIQWATHAIHYENLVPGLETTFGQTITATADPRHGTQDKLPWREYYHDTTLELLNHHWGWYLHRFGYKWANDTIILTQEGIDKWTKPV